MAYDYNKEYFISLYERHCDMVYRICYFYLSNKHDAQDAVQSVFTNILKKELKFNDFEHEKAFLIVSAKNYCKDVLKSFWVKKRVNYDEINELCTKNNKNINSDIIYNVMNLPYKYKIPVYLYYYEGYSVKEISEILGEKETTIQTQLSRARKKLKLQLEKEGFYDGKRSKRTV